MKGFLGVYVFSKNVKNRNRLSRPNEPKEKRHQLTKEVEPKNTQVKSRDRLLLLRNRNLHNKESLDLDHQCKVGIGGKGRNRH